MSAERAPHSDEERMFVRHVRGAPPPPDSGTFLIGANDDASAWRAKLRGPLTGNNLERVAKEVASASETDLVSTLDRIGMAFVDCADFLESDAPPSLLEQYLLTARGLATKLAGSPTVACCTDLFGGHEGLPLRRIVDVRRGECQPAVITPPCSAASPGSPRDRRRVSCRGACSCE